MKTKFTATDKTNYQDLNPHKGRIQLFTLFPA